MRISDNVSNRVNFSPKYCSAVAEKAIMSPLVFMQHEATFLGSRYVLI